MVRNHVWHNAGMVATAMEAWSAQCRLETLCIVSAHILQRLTKEQAPVSVQLDIATVQRCSVATAQVDTAEVLFMRRGSRPLLTLMSDARAAAHGLVHMGMSR